MAKIAVKIRILPESVDVSLDDLKKKCVKEIESYGGIVRKTEEQPIAFGLIALEFTFVYDEAKGQLDPLEGKLSAFKGVRSAEVTDVRRMLG